MKRLLFLFLLLTFSAPAHVAQTVSQAPVGPLRVSTADGAASLNGVREIVFPTGSVHIDGRKVVINAVGATGATGATGPAGTNGATWRQGSTVPSNSLGVDGDFYFRTSTGDVYQRASGSYSIIANITGPTGATGAAGAAGAPGSVWRNGSGAPSNALGINGDYYLDSATGDVYLKASNAYSSVANIRGPTGNSTTYAARAYNSANQSIPNATVTVLTFDSERWDSDTIHSTVSNTSRLTATTAGLYSIGAGVFFDSNATGSRSVQIKLNGTTVIAASQGPALAGGLVTGVVTSTEYSMAAGDFVECVVYQDSGGSLNVRVLNNYSAEFWMTRMGPRP